MQNMVYIILKKGETMLFVEDTATGKWGLPSDPAQNKPLEQLAKQGVEKLATGLTCGDFSFFCADDRNGWYFMEGHYIGIPHSVQEGINLLESPPADFFRSRSNGELQEELQYLRLKLRYKAQA